ncbi:MAG: 5'-methylthioadenosine/S-adenosylhomocysteine nucleosidase [Ramlibacter sp.]|nr:5'-methylthioadenosine/S-adenosylhomocysteine nucleosidase [Ramlibacter sp.]
MPTMASGLRRLLGPAALALTLAGASLLGGCAATGPAVTAQGGKLDSAERIVVMSAFAPELVLLKKQLQSPAVHSVNGVEFTTGQLQGHPVVLMLSGISMTNAAMNTQLVLDRFKVSRIVFSGIAGGVNPALHIGDVSVPEQWGQYLEVVMARETAPGQFTPPSWTKGTTLPPYGMLFPRPVETRVEGQPQPVRKFWFEADPKMLAVARTLGSVPLAHCLGTKCLSHTPKVTVGGNGVSGQAFMDNAAFREYTFKTFQANVLDMETAAVGHVAYSNGVPYIAFRSLSDLAGGGEGENEMGTFLGLAADNSAKVMLAFLAAWKP